MASVQKRRGLIATIIVLAITVVAVATVVALMNLNKPVETTVDEPETTEVKPEETEEPTDDPVDEPSTSPAPAVDPATLSSIDIEPLEITVFYSKGVGGFEFSVLRTSSGTRYVDFSVPELVGTKCTNDEGVFASIIEGVKEQEDNTTITQTVTVAGTTYGLTLAGDNCAADVALLEQYQTAFSNGFSHLKAME